MDPLVATLRAAGCVFAEDEARILREAATDAEHLAVLTARRVTGEPLEHVVGWADFHGVRVRVAAGVFIPRQRTALLVDAAAELCPPGATVLDLCCGSGALGLALARLAPGIRLHACDSSSAAVACARENLDGIGTVAVGDLFDAVPDEWRGGVDVILANVPYVPERELAHMPVEAREHEPRATHDGGADGLAVFRRVAAEAAAWLAPGGSVLSEIEEHQADAARAVLADGGLSSRLVVDEETETTVLVGTR